MNNTIFNLKIKIHGSKNKIIKNINLNLIGKHNLLNAANSIAICMNLGIKIEIIKKALMKFSGVQRRLSLVFKKDNREFYDDYAHQPTEISSVLEGLRKINLKTKNITNFQTHRFKS